MTDDSDRTGSQPLDRGREGAADDENGPGAAIDGSAGYTGGLATGNMGAAGMRQVVADEAGEARREGAAEEPPSNLAQQDQ